MFLTLAIESLGFGEALGISVLGFVIVICVLAVLALFVKLLTSVVDGASKAVGKGKKENNKAIASQPAAEAPAEVTETESNGLPYTPGYVTLDGVSEQDAAVIMAITSEKTGIPLERLCFRSIKRLNQSPKLVGVSEQDAAVIMAITSEKTGIPLENLQFNSIKLMEGK
ncbi:MAG: OadG family protein [Acutalibacteraceae bacterium]